MKRTTIAKFALLTAAALAVGCSRAPESNEPPKTVEITGNDQMKFDVTAIQAKPGQKVQVTLKNTGTMPKESMGHDFVLLDKNTDVAKFIENGTTNAATDYVPPDMKSKVLAKTKIIGPGESDTVTFTAPRIVGDYDFVCTFPGHYASGMKGKLTVAY